MFAELQRSSVARAVIFVFLLQSRSQSLWIGDASCWQGPYTYNKCCGNTNEHYLNGFGLRGDRKCWSEADNFTYERCCLANLPRTEVLLHQMRGRLQSGLDAFMKADFPDYDCRHAPDPPPLSRGLAWVLNNSLPGACNLDYDKTFWGNFKFVVRRRVQLWINGWVDTEIDNCVILLVSTVFAKLDNAVRWCPLGVAVAAAIELLGALTTVGTSSAYAVERYDLLLRLVMERFSPQSLMVTEWQLFSWLYAIESRNIKMPLEQKYVINYDFPMWELDFKQLKALQSQLEENGIWSVAALTKAALRRSKSSWSPLAWSTLKALKALNTSNIVMLTYAYGDDYAALVPAFARRIRKLAIDSVVLACGDEATLRSCRENWWPSADFCIRSQSTQKQALKYTLPTFILHAGLDVFVFQFDAILLKDPRPHLRHHHDAHDVAHVAHTYCYYIRHSRVTNILMYALLQYLHEYGSFVVEMWALDSFARHDQTNVILLPYMPLDALPKLQTSNLDQKLFAQNIPGWDCKRHSVDDLILFHLHSPLGASKIGVDMTVGTTFGNASALLSSLDAERDAVLNLYCNWDLPLVVEPGYNKPTRGQINMPLL